MRYRVKFADRPKVDPCVMMSAIVYGQAFITADTGSLGVRHSAHATGDSFGVVVGGSTHFPKDIDRRVLPVDLAAVKIVPKAGGGYTVDGWKEMVEAKSPKHEPSRVESIQFGSVVTMGDSDTPYVVCRYDACGSHVLLQGIGGRGDQVRATWGKMVHPLTLLDTIEAVEE